MDDIKTSRATYFIRSLLLLLPNQRCRLCGSTTSSSQLCHPCMALLYDTTSRCKRCAHPLSDPPARDLTCGQCLRNPPPYRRTITAHSYQEPIDLWINQFKHRRDLRDGHLLSQQLTYAVRASYLDEPLPQLLIPVPLHWQRQLLRSFNQACWITRCLQKNLEIPALNALKRTSNNHSQQGLGRRARLNNLKRSFQLVDRHREAIQGQRIALIDDVVTTTSTARTISKLLLKEGAAEVDIWCLARTSDQHRIKNNHNSVEH